MSFGTDNQNQKDMNIKCNFFLWVLFSVFSVVVTVCVCVYFPAPNGMNGMFV